MRDHTFGPFRLVASRGFVTLALHAVVLVQVPPALFRVCGSELGWLLWLSAAYLAASWLAASSVSVFCVSTLGTLHSLHRDSHPLNALASSSRCVMLFVFSLHLPPLSDLVVLESVVYKEFIVVREGVASIFEVGRDVLLLRLVAHRLL